MCRCNEPYQLTGQDKAQVIKWLCDGMNLSTVAQHFGLDSEELKKQIHQVRMDNEKG